MLLTNTCAVTDIGYIIYINLLINVMFSRLKSILIIYHQLNLSAVLKIPQNRQRITYTIPLIVFSCLSPRFEWVRLSMFTHILQGWLTSRKVWVEITYPFPNFDGCNVRVWEWISNFIPQFIMDVITYPCWDWSKSMLVLGATGGHSWYPYPGILHTMQPCACNWFENLAPAGEMYGWSKFKWVCVDFTSRYSTTIEVLVMVPRTTCPIDQNSRDK